MPSFDGSSARDKQGRYQRMTQDIKDNSVIATIIQEEADQFFSNVTNRLNSLDEDSLSDEAISRIGEIKKDVKAAFTELFGNAMTSSALTIHRGPSPWNGFFRDNYKRKLSEFQAENSAEGTLIYGLIIRLTTAPSFKDIAKALSQEWSSKDEEFRKDYPPEGNQSNSANSVQLGDCISSQEDNNRRKRQRIWNNMKADVILSFNQSLILEQCDLLDRHYGVSTLIYYVDKYDMSRTAQLYWHAPEPADKCVVSDEPMPNRVKIIRKVEDPVEAFVHHAISKQIESQN